MQSNKIIITDDIVLTKIYLVRGQKIMLDRDLAELYGVETKKFNQAVKRNQNRFPEDFSFKLTEEEFENLRSQFVTSSWGGTRYFPMAFTGCGYAFQCFEQ
ncbi:MAG: ORF6N domain-containing protein [Sediminibacterium sp.]|nr:ORF6N domain-containing protein [Sediminibacterium sp.]